MSMIPEARSPSGANGTSALPRNELVWKAQSIRMKTVESLKERFVLWIWNRTPNCAEMSRLASHSFEGSISIQTRFRMWLHYSICAWCKRYAQHLIFLRAAAPHLKEHVDESIPRRLSLEARRRILQKLKSEQAGV